jgi:hypothetical protein
MTLRGFKLSVVSLGVLYFTYLTIENPQIWTINLVLWPLCLLVVLDRGHVKAIDRAYGAVKHLKGKSERADAMLIALSSERLKSAKIYLIHLQIDFPEEEKPIEEAISALDTYLTKQPWWRRFI